MEKWTDKFDSGAHLVEVRGEWELGLSALTGEQIGRGLEVCRESMVWPPSIAEFRLACVGADGGRLHGSGAYKPFVALPKLQCDKAVGSAALLGMRRSL